mmetsp:Transcript_16027/g.37140  ORF Transcript_16027/g.37140 Transcript_16027/m.37140 type:complete len:478 (+) Transcript_16027:210-1643(+)|eukprot:CAMPEP_0197184658 /NCGR_PEP_ID=MMETSP1423-20130617/10280_1 /TAXON_ID=476441 /ORGANISM="Pseudo-nitzschia heimii, Strain UNC1101" /LENGTH=477 /DNA_ID=CAMNT_0042635529 /DNA_START=100 /DNA_END=1533 /DNA_ORIENTATION=-
MSCSIFKTLTALSLLTTVVQATPISYVVGGSKADEGDFPYFVEMQGCGGALIAPDAVLFAAHCAPATGDQVIIGAYEQMKLDHGAKTGYCEEWVQHPSYDGGSEMNWDFALCKLAEPVTIDESRVKLVWNDNPSVPADNDLLTVMGMGALKEGSAANPSASATFLQKVDVPVVPTSECREDRMYGADITDQMLCAGFAEGERDACQGDSGGPLVKRVPQADGTFIDYHVGVVSFGRGCARANKPGVYARTSEARSFIEETVCDNWGSGASFCSNNSGPPQSPPCEAELDVFVETDTWGFETSWSLKEQISGEEISTRSYKIADFDNSHKVCVKKNTCYTFNITDSHGDGVCFDENDCGLYELQIPGEAPFKSNANFNGAFEVTQFCIDSEGDQTNELQERDDTPSHETECKDDKTFKFKGDRGCGFVSRKRTGKARRLCKKSVRGGRKTVSDFCSKTCGEVGIGNCDHLKEKRKKKN